MTPKLSDEQRAALEQQAGRPVLVIDPVRQAEYVLIPAETYQRMRALLAPEHFDIRATYTAQEQALGAGGWNDPALDAYNDYDAHHLPPQ